jgi:hypothetical protein
MGIHGIDVALKEASQVFLYENVLIHFSGKTAVVTYRSKYEYPQRTQYYLLLRVYMKRAREWKMLAGQGFRVKK